MTIATFRADLYSGTAIDEAAKAYERVATFAIEKEDGVYQVTITATGQFDESRIALEFQNFALGATIERLKSGREVDRQAGERR